MSTGQNVTRYLFYSVWSVLMTALTYVLGAVSLKVLRQRYGRLLYWLTTMALTGGLVAVKFYALALVFFNLVVLIGVFAEFEEWGLSFSLSTFFAVLINSLLTGGAFALWVYSVGAKWSQQLTSTIETLLQPLKDLNPAFQINAQEIMLQLPSITLILWMSAIYLAILLENRLNGVDSAAADSNGTMPMRRQLAEFKVADPAVWILILALLGAFGSFEVKWVETLSLNALNVCVLIFFFQGIAVVSRFFETIRMGFFWQFLFMVLIIVHLFLIVSLVGLLDYWLDFRARMTKRSQEQT